MINEIYKNIKEFVVVSNDNINDIVFKFENVNNEFNKVLRNKQQLYITASKKIIENNYVDIVLKESEKLFRFDLNKIKNTKLYNSILGVLVYRHYYFKRPRYVGMKFLYFNSF